MKTCIEVIHAALLETARPNATLQPRRIIMDLPGTGDACLGLMPGSMSRPDCFGVKATAVFPANFGTAFQSHQGTVTLFERANGRPVALLHGGEITGIRTAAASAVATRALARSDATKLAILGYGEQAALHVEAMGLVRDLELINVWGRDPDRAFAFARLQQKLTGIRATAVPTVEEAIRDADVVCTTTAAREPILRGRDLNAGCHLNVVGSSVARFREIDTEAVARTRFFVDNRAMAMAEAGEYRLALQEGAITEAHIVAEIGEVLAGVHAGRSRPEDVTLYRSLGMPVEDLAAGMHVLAEAEKHGIGTVVDF